MIRPDDLTPALLPGTYGLRFMERVKWRNRSIRLGLNADDFFAAKRTLPRHILERLKP
jgi:hypothetical protein